MNRGVGAAMSCVNGLFERIGTMPRKPVSGRSDAEYMLLWFDALNERERFEYGLIRAIWCDPLNGYTLADSLGIRQRHFRARHDLMLMFLAFRLGGQRGRQAVFDLCCDALEAEHCWSYSDDHRNCRGPRWTERSLSDFTDEFCTFPSPMQAHAIRETAEQLLEVDGRMRDSESHYDEAVRLLQREILPQRLREYAVEVA
jgi:hypothetical protein